MTEPYVLDKEAFLKVELSGKTEKGIAQLMADSTRN